jgi:DNA polymerase-3 subunit gamma/tau
VLDLVVKLEERKVEESLKIVSNIVEQGLDIKYYLSFLINVLHNYLLSMMGISENNKSETFPFKFNLEEIKQLTQLFTRAYGEMKTAVLPQLPLELAVIEWCEEDKLKVQNAKLKVTGETSYISKDEEEVSVSSLRKQVGTMKKLKALYGEKKKEPEVEVSIETTSVELMQTNGSGPVTKEWMELFWRNLINEMKKYNHTTAGVLRGCTIKSYAEQSLVIQTAYKFHKERLDDMKNREALLRIAKLLTGKDVAITVELRK